MARPTHHFYVHHKANKKTRKKQATKLTVFDNFVLTLSFIYPFTGVPQAVGVWHGGGSMATAITWSGFFLFGFIFLTYGIIHKVKPMIINNTIWSFIDLAIIIGALHK